MSNLLTNCCWSNRPKWHVWLLARVPLDIDDKNI
jgi:hypothetical protein